jgi:hypothetical protein
MSHTSSGKNKIFPEIIKILVISLPLFTGIIVYVYFISKGFSSLRNFLFYLFIAVSIISYQVIFFFIRRKRIIENYSQIGSSSNLPSSLLHKSSSPKEAVKIDEHAISYCLSCGKSFTKKYSFCPNCGSCKISSFM